MDRRSKGTYLVEIASQDEAGSPELAARARRSAGSARFLRSIYVPEDDRWFLLYEGASEDEVAAAAARAQLAVVSIAVAESVDKRGRR
ncbi:MAG: hypothetical protein NZL88_05475 [Gaiellaceae bacterium]|nr:hypothetical protein [Gaiellaceae bacterium]